ncbi:MAG: carcinine hydrolase/isopenicillin-N N-acyltransferase family protein [Dysgonamonadaceae bacterium]|nr:carcinine hydrolase/isopenicillin-N N-acyltransferase family protein [Dysgonamonadaceae bacterium]MDD4728265.1 carcinine hydrolase/isopenicillin-N N-acyltransferase family protein [Dysgonamonadaceae bacterium]
MKIKHALLIIISIFSVLNATIHACTTAVIAARNSANGRSMIWKLRDTDNIKNAMRFFDDGKYTYLGLVNSNDTLGLEVWGGTNSAGFAIMNSASYNVNVGDTTQLKDQEGIFMKLALQTCASLQDLENLLNTYPKPRGQASHYGVIDANGGAAYYEVNNWTWTKFDANDTEIAPNGYIIRTNYSESGTKNKGYGFIRREAAETVFKKALQNNKLDYRTVIQRFSRCSFHPVFGINYREKFESGTNESSFVASDDLITRHSSASSIIVEGVKPNESPTLTTIWTLVGYPNTCIAMPLWIAGGKNIPNILRYNSELQNSPLNEAAKEWKNKCYPLTRSDGYHYLKLDELINTENSGYIQRIEPLESTIFNESEEMLAKWRNQSPSTAEIESFYKKLNKKVSDFYSIFDLP